MASCKRRWVRQPKIQLDARGEVETHGLQTPLRIVIHTTESHDHPKIKDLQGIVDYWKRQDRGLGAHLIIDRAGNSAWCAEFHKIAWAVARRNTGSIHIELIGFARFTPKLWWKRIKQLNKTAKWIAYLNLVYGIPIQFGPNWGVSGHRDQPRQSHTDPGRWFPMKYLLRRAKQFRAKGWT